MIPVKGLNDANNSSPDMQTQVENMWANVPTFRRFIFISTCSIYLSSFIFVKIPAFLVTQPLMIIYSLQIWRMFTGPFVHVQLLQLLFGMMSYISTAMQQEKLDGTVKMAFRFFLNAVLIEMLFVVACYLFAMFVNPQFMMMFSIGLWPILFCDITIECNKSPDLSRGLCCLPIQIKSKYYPWALLALFTMFFGLQLDLFVGLAVGYMHIFKSLDKFQFSTDRAKLWEAKLPFKEINPKTHFVAADGSAGLHTFVRTATPQQNNQNTRASQPPAQTQQPATFSAFKGKCTALGGDTLITSGKAKSTTSDQSYGSIKSTSSASSNSYEQQRSRSVLGQSALIDSLGKPNKGANDLDDSIGHAKDKQGGNDKQYQQVRNNTDDNEEELDINLQ